MEALRVFISSIMNPSIEDLLKEREAARRAVEHFAPITKPWAFETEPASTKPLLDFYLGAVRTCDLFVLIVGRCVTEPVKAEYQTARDYEKPILAFRKNVSSRLPEAEEVLRLLDRKWDSFSDAVELQEHLRTALGTELLRQIRGDGYRADGHGDRVARLRRFAADGTAVRVSPLIPEIQLDLFSVKEVQPQTMVLEKQSSRQLVGVPLQRVAEILDQGNNEPPVVMIQGRLQWLTLKREWNFFPGLPVQALGIPRDVDFSSQSALMTAIRAAGKEPIVSRLEWVPRRTAEKTHEVFYDDNGYYLRQRARDTDSVLMVTK